MSSDLNQRLSAADPARALHPDITEADWNQLAHAIMGTERREQSEPGAASAAPVVSGPPPTPAFRARRAAVVLVAAAALVAAPVGFNLSGRPSGASVAAAGVLEQAAVSAVDPVATADQYWKITTTGGGVSMTVETRNGVDVFANWWSSDSTISYVAVDGARPTFTQSRWGDKQHQVSGEPGLGYSPGGSAIETTNLSPNDGPGGWQTPTPAFYSTIPRDLEALRDRLYTDAEGHGKSTDGEVLVIAADTLRTGLVPADLRSALFQVLKTVPGVDVTANTVTIEGRTGVGIARTETEEGGTRQEIIIDPISGVLIGERQIAVDGGHEVPAGTVITQSAVSRTLVDQVPDRIRAQAHYSTCTVGDGGHIDCS